MEWMIDVMIWIFWLWLVTDYKMSHFDPSAFEGRFWSLKTKLDKIYQISAFPSTFWLFTWFACQHLLSQFRLTRKQTSYSPQKMTDVFYVKLWFWILFRFLMTSRAMRFTSRDDDERTKLLHSDEIQDDYEVRKSIQYPELSFLATLWQMVFLPDSIFKWTLWI